MSDKNIKAAEAVKVRVIMDHPGYAIDTVATLTAEEAASAVAAGWADDHPSAVAYAESIAPAEAPAADA